MGKLISVRVKATGSATQSLKDVETGILYETVKGGFSWPGVHPGFICIAARESEKESIRVLHESYEDSLDELAKHLSTLEDLFFVESWVADYEGKNFGFRDLLSELGVALDTSFALMNPRLSSNFHLGIQLLRRCFKRNVLILPRGGILETRINILNERSSGEEGLNEKFHEVATLANIIYEFDSIRKEAEKPKDPWEFDNNGSKVGWMGMWAEKQRIYLNRSLTTKYPHGSRG
jgi:hypothetical protein